MKITIPRLTPLALVLAVLASVPAVAQSQSEEQARRQAEQKAQQELELKQKELELKQQEFEKQQRLTEKERRAVEEKLRAKAREMRDAQREVERLARELARSSSEKVARERELSRFVYFGGKARLGIVVNPGSDPESDTIGAKIVGVSPGGPADDAGLKTGDIIVKVNGERLSARSGDDEDAMTPSKKLLELASELEDGDQVDLEYRRGSDTRTVKVVARSGFGPELKVMVDPDIVIPAAPDIPDIPDVGNFEVRVSPRVGLPLAMDLEMISLNPDLGRYFGTSSGILVLDAPRDSKLKLLPGDVIVKIDGREPSSPSKVLRILSSYEPGESVSIEIMRDKKPLELTVTMPEHKAGVFWMRSAPAPPAPAAVAAPEVVRAPRSARGTGM